MDTYRDKIDEENVNREDLITRQDIQNIKRTYHINISDGVKHCNDVVSVDLWVAQCKEDYSNTVLFYKKQGVEDDTYNLCAVDFCLILMTDFQKNMINKFGNNIIAIDGTHGLNNYDFELTTLLVVDECGEGIPVGFMFTNRKDTYIYEVYFNVVKLHVSVITPKTFMSDIVSTFYSAWCSVMGPVSHQLFCSWHIDRAWQQNLSKISDKTKRAEVYKALKCLQQNTSIDEFDMFLENTITQLINDSDTKNFGVYFQNNYGCNYKNWAYCYRKGCGINTNMRLESMHKTIKYFYLDGKKVKRLDKTLHVLLKFIRDKYVNRLISKVKGKYTIHLKEIIQKHMHAMSSNFSVDRDKENDKKWYISTISNNSDKQEVHCVEKIFNQSCCDLKCKECQVCYHTYTCTCNSFYVANSICKHIHFIEMSYFPKIAEESLWENPKTSSEEEKFCGGNSSPSIEQSTTLCIKKKDTLKIHTITKLQNTLTKLQNTDSSKLDDEIFMQIQMHVSTIDKLLDLPISSTASAVPTFSKSADGGDQSNNEPPNKKIKKQQRFFSTTNRKKVKQSINKKPSKQEIPNIKENIKNNFSNTLYVSHSTVNDHTY